MAELTLGLDPIKLRVQAPTLRNVRRWIRGPELKEVLHVLPRAAEVRVDTRDEAIVEWSLNIVNFSSRELRPSRITVDQWLFNTRIMPNVAPAVHGLDRPIRRRSIGALGLTFHLPLSGVRRIVDAAAEARNVKSTPRSPLRFVGGIYFHDLREEFRYELEDSTPKISIGWP